LNKIATIGFFDGVHKGHRFLFEQLCSEADKRGLEPLLITFDTHPRAVLHSDYQPQLLSSLEERKALLRAYAEVMVLPFAAIKDLTAQQFMSRMRTEWNVSVLLMGYDHTFGSDRLKRSQDYRRIGAEIGMEVLTMEEFTDGEWHVSSTEIRQALENGNIALANELLGRPYSLTGQVVHGKAIGRTIGFPTANILPDDPQKIIPKPGVYMAHVDTPTMDSAPAFVNIDHQHTIEVHIPSFKGDLYDRHLEVRFAQYLRDEKHFETLEQLQLQIREDIDSILRRDA